MATSRKEHVETLAPHLEGYRDARPWPWYSSPAIQNLRQSTHAGERVGNRRPRLDDVRR